MPKTIKQRTNINVFKASSMAFTILFLILSISKVQAHSSSLNKIALDVCKVKKRSQACQYNGGHNDLYIGTCQYISENDLTCVRNQPIQKVASDKGSHKTSHHDQQGSKLKTKKSKQD